MLPGDEVVQRYGAAADRQFLIRLPLGRRAPTPWRTRSGRSPRRCAADLPAFEFEKRELVSAMIGGDLQRRGIYAVAASLAAIAIYIGFRFRFAFAMGAIAATLHDVLITLACVSLAGYDLTLNVVAALLTIIGYSVNDTIVIFDRVRENAKQMPRRARCGGQPERQSDAVAHGDHRRHDVPLGGGALPVRRRGAAGICVHDAGRHRRRHLFDGVHRLGDRDLLSWRRTRDEARDQSSAPQRGVYTSRMTLPSGGCLSSAAGGTVRASAACAHCGGAAGLVALPRPERLGDFDGDQGADRVRPRQERAVEAAAAAGALVADPAGRSHLPDGAA